MSLRPAPTSSHRGRPASGLGLLALTLAVLLGLMLAPASGVAAQEAQGLPPGQALPADPADVESLDAILAAVYDVISGPAGEARDWDRFRSLFMPSARLIPTVRGPQGAVGARVMSPDDYAAMAGPALQEGGFFEIELGRTVERFGPVVHVMSAYASKRTQEDPEPFARGVNSFQLLDTGERWYIVSIFWATETPDTPIPAELIGG